VIEVKVAGFADGRGYFKGTPGTEYKTGTFVKLTTSWSTEAPGTPGKAYNGATCYIVTTDSGDQNVYPMNKLLYKPEEEETESDYVISGDGVIVYKSGQYETDNYNTTDTLSSLTPGTLLYTDENGLLCTGCHGSKNAKPRAMYIGMYSSYSSKQSARAMLWYELLPQTYVTSGILGF